MQGKIQQISIWFHIHWYFLQEVALINLTKRGSRTKSPHFSQAPANGQVCSPDLMLSTGMDITDCTEFQRSQLFCSCISWPRPHDSVKHEALIVGGSLISKFVFIYRQLFLDYLLFLLWNGIYSQLPKNKWLSLLLILSLLNINWPVLCVFECNF